MTRDGIVDRSVRNIFWSYSSFFLTKVLNLAAIVILARVLTPSDFGMVAFCIVIAGYFELLARFGLGAALISAGDDVEGTADAVFAYALVFAAGVAALLWIAAPHIAAFAERPELVGLLRVLALTPVIEAAATVHNSLLQRELRFRLKLFPDIARGLVKGIASIALAFLGFGVWSLVYGHLAGAIVSSLILILVRPWRPSGLPGRAASRRVLSYGTRLLGAESINGLAQGLPSIVIGKMLGVGLLGIFTHATRIPELTIKNFGLIAGTVAHPMMARMQGDDEALRQYFYGCLRYFALLTLPGAAALAVVADPLVRLLYTEEWYGMIAPMQLLCVAFAIKTINLLPGSIYKAINRPEYLLRVSVVMLPVLGAALAASVPYGLETVALALVGVALFEFIPDFLVLRSAIGITVGNCLRALLPGVVCAAVTAGAAAAALGLGTAPLPVELALAALAAAAAYLGTLRLMSPEVLSEAVRMIWKRRATA